MDIRVSTIEPQPTEANDVSGGMITVQSITSGDKPTEQAPCAADHSPQPYSDFRVLAELLPVMVAMITDRGHSKYLNRCWRTYTGLAERDSMHLGWTQAFQKDDREQLLNLLDYPHDPDGFEVEVNIRRASDGCYRRHKCRCVRVPVEGDRVTRWLVCCIDVEDWRNSEEAARAQAALLGLSVRTYDEEKRKIANALHDRAGQYLIALQMKLDGLQRNSASGPRKNPFIDECRQLVMRCSREFRAISYLLHPPLLDELGLESAIRYHVDSFMDRTKVKLELNIESNLGRFDRELEVALFRVIKEALAIIARHSAKEAQIKVGTSAATVFVEVTASGGIGGLAAKFGTSSNTTAGLGVALTCERIRSTGGNFEVASASDEVVIRATVPRKALVAHACD